MSQGDLRGCCASAQSGTVSITLSVKRYHLHDVCRLAPGPSLVSKVATPRRAGADYASAKFPRSPRATGGAATESLAHD